LFIFVCFNFQEAALHLPAFVHEKIKHKETFLNRNFLYQKLSFKQQQIFEHRLACFMSKYKFIGNGVLSSRINAEYWLLHIRNADFEWI
jgi:hypothetical protein